MNAAIRAVVRTASYHKLRVSGVYRGFQGLIEGDIEELGPRSVANIIQRGGTILRTARSSSFTTEEGRAEAARNLERHGIGGLVVIGGDGSFHGSHLFAQEHGLPVMGIPGTIDNDLYGTDVSIGFNTAMNIALDAIDRLRDTAASHDRLFLVEVMGRNAGHIALNVGVAAGAEAILIPEATFDIDELVRLALDAETRGKSSSIFVVAEGACPGGAMAVKRELEAKCRYEVRTSILGHIQRGGPPSTLDRVLASRLGYLAVIHLIEGRHGVMVGLQERGAALTPLQDTWKRAKPVDWQLFEIAKILAI